MDLAIDVGNTLTKFGLGEGGEILSSYEFQTEPSRRRDELRSRILAFLAGERPRKAILSSVVPSLLGEYRAALEGIAGRLIVLGPGLKTGLVLHVENPREVGSDLVAGAYAAKSLFGKNLFIADFGTATKYIYLDQQTRFAGLSIAPGLEISAKALSKDEETAVLNVVHAYEVLLTRGIRGTYVFALDEEVREFLKGLLPSES